MGVDDEYGEEGKINEDNEMNFLLFRKSQTLIRHYHDHQFSKLFWVSSIIYLIFSPHFYLIFLSDIDFLCMWSMIYFSIWAMTTSSPSQSIHWLLPSNPIPSSLSSHMDLEDPCVVSISKKCSWAHKASRFSLSLSLSMFLFRKFHKNLEI